MDPEQTRQRIRHYLALLYPGEDASRLLADLEQVIARHRPPAAPAAAWSEHDALLIAYGDMVRGPKGEPGLKSLHRFLGQYVGSRFTCLHLLPFYPYTSDDGFAVSDFRTVRPEIGDWAAVRDLGRQYHLCFDVVLNHVSASHPWVRGYLNGDTRYTDFFTALDPATDTSSVLRTRSLPLLHRFESARGPRWLWTTFGPDQLDLHYANPKVLAEVLELLLFYVGKGARMLRLDAVAYVWKKLGTSCAHLPETHAIIRLLRALLDLAAPEVTLLAEVNTPDTDNFPYLGGDDEPEADLVYNFALPPLILYACRTGDATVLTRWADGLAATPRHSTYLNVTATHDGIGMRATEGVLTDKQRQFLCDNAIKHQGRVSGKTNADGSISPYELNLNYFDALNDPAADDLPIEMQVTRFMLSQAIVLGFMGVPGVYLHSLLGSRGDRDAVARTDKARAINRATLDLAKVTDELLEPSSLRARVFDEYCRLLEIRGRESAFHPHAGQAVLDADTRLFTTLRYNPITGEAITAAYNVSGRWVVCGTQNFADDGRLRDLIEGTEFAVGAGTAVPMAPYQARWLKHIA